jgi:phosphoribosylanthranilate isomerase
MKIKVCGLTSEKEAQYLRDVDFAGFVLFFEKSKRNITIEQAEKIIRKLDNKIKSVAVVVKPTTEQIKAIDESLFDYVQIHGEITSDVLREVKTPILKAFNVDDMDNFEFYHSCDKIKGYVFDAQIPGSGKTFDWSSLTNIPRDDKLFMLAGGLNPSNVGSAIKFIKPDGVDVSSGVENENGIGKSEEKIKQFVENVRKAYQI